VGNIATGKSRVSRFGHAGRLYRSEWQLARCPVIVGLLLAFGKTTERNGHSCIDPGPSGSPRALYGLFGESLQLFLVRATPAPRMQGPKQPGNWTL